ncbi:hypothetical protein [Streptomyces sp. AM6-12]|uniref:hypothetical protein n=1 Tax=Streptomyces sp. AM6-12 TaxID=3345149 RepID=UPI0037A56614
MADVDRRMLEPGLDLELGGRQAEMPPADREPLVHGVYEAPVRRLGPPPLRQSAAADVKGAGELVGDKG